MKTLEDIMYNSYQNTVAIQGDFDLTVPIYDTDRKVDYSVLLGLLLISNADIKEPDTRYIEYCRINKNKICKELNISNSTLDRKIKYLIQKGIILYKNTENGLTYFINSNKECNFIKVNHKILYYLYCNFDSKVIKLYLILKLQCEVLESDNPINRAYLCSVMGLSPKSATNLKSVGIWINQLLEHNLIEKEDRRIYKKNTNGKTCIDRVDTYYKIMK